MSDLFLNYQALVRKVDMLCREIEAAYEDQVSCRKGCDSCCRIFSVFPVEAFNLARAFSELEGNIAAGVRERAEKAGADDQCPFLERGECLVYEDRPIICRTHGLPILVRDEAGKTVLDYCRSNFGSVESLPGNAMINLEQLNTLLVAVNAHFVSRWEQDATLTREKMSLAEAILLEYR